MRRVASDPETGIGAPFSGGFELANLILKIAFGISAELPLRHVETAALGLCVHVTDVIGDRLFFFLQPLDTFDEGVQLLVPELHCRLFPRNAPGRRIESRGSGQARRAVIHSSAHVKALHAIVRLRKQDTDERREQQAILETYMHALGMD